MDGMFGLRRPTYGASFCQLSSLGSTHATKSKRCLTGACCTIIRGLVYKAIYEIEAYPQHPQIRFYDLRGAIGGYIMLNI